MDASPFSKLSAELRNTIYELAATSDETHHIVHCRYGDAAKLERRVPDPNSLEHIMDKYPREGWSNSSTYDYDLALRPDLNILALQETCSEIRNESTALFYAVNKFFFDSPKGFQSFCAMVGEKNLAALRDVKVDVGRFCSLARRSVEVMVKGAQMIAKTMAEVVGMNAMLPECSIRMEYVLYDSPTWWMMLTADARELLTSLASARQSAKGGKGWSYCALAIGEVEMAMRGEGSGE